MCQVSQQLSFLLKSCSNLNLELSLKNMGRFRVVQNSVTHLFYECEPNIAPVLCSAVLPLSDIQGVVFNQP